MSKIFHGHTEYSIDPDDDAVNEHPYYSDHSGLINERTGEPLAGDMVNSPKHYTEAPVECIDAMKHCFGEDQVRIYAKIAAFKYLWRSQQKHATDSEDLAKAQWYILYANGNDPRAKS